MYEKGKHWIQRIQVRLMLGAWCCFELFNANPGVSQSSPRDFERGKGAFHSTYKQARRLMHIGSGLQAVHLNRKHIFMHILLIFTRVFENLRDTGCKTKYSQQGGWGARDIYSKLELLKKALILHI